ncbi:MAG: N-methylhydantoinase [Thermomicrobiales bacterium]|nr:N-methylhydantoinase [Thermomicrobiales bacterium]
MEEATGATVALKVPSTPSDPAQAVLNGIRELVAAYGVDPGEIEYFVHGTTIALNTLIQRSGARCGLLVTRGFRDILEIGRLRLPDPTNYFVQKVRPLVQRSMVREIDGRLLASGEVYQPLDLAQLDAAARELIGLGAEAIAICFMHSYKSDQHERSAADYLRTHFPDVYVTASSEIWPQQREFERATVTVINAHVGDRMRRYFDRLENNFRDIGIPATIFTTKSNGGVMTARSASDVPVETLLSGPSAGVMGALHVGRLAGHHRLITLDIGGTSADVSIIDQDVHYSTDNQVGDFPVFMPAIDISSIGAGGGSIAWVDQSGLLKVGPKSAGADPGPAAYGRGGVQPTLTDAYITLGLIRPENFLGGRLPLDAAKADAALATVGKPLGLDARATASSVLEVTTANMYAQFMPLMAKRGIDPRDFTLFAYGGAGPTHAFFLAREVDIKRVIVPRSPGTLCALGSLVTDIKSDFIKTLYVDSNQFQIEDLDAQFSALEGVASDWLTAQNVKNVQHQLLRSADMRYRGQSFDITVPLSAAFATGEDLSAVREPFHQTYERVYGFCDRDAPVEIINARVTIVGVTPKPAAVPTRAATSGPRPAEPIATRSVLEYRQQVVANVFQWDALGVGETFTGPAIVEAVDTTVYVPTGFAAEIDAWGNIIAEDVRDAN